MYQKIKNLKSKIKKHQQYYESKYALYKKMDKNEAKTFTRFRRLIFLSGLIMDLILELSDLEMQVAAENLA